MNDAVFSETDLRGEEISINFNYSLSNYRNLNDASPHWGDPAITASMSDSDFRSDDALSTDRRSGFICNKSDCA
ncbi:MAG TPA: hypothetical protein VN455_00255, partial [Methanotrichaceae archaeon]|nr:hypothetical protein [Methanotrichaceae archaeon]